MPSVHNDTYGMEQPHALRQRRTRKRATPLLQVSTQLREKRSRVDEATASSAATPNDIASTMAHLPQTPSFSPTTRSSNPFPEQQDSVQNDVAPVSSSGKCDNQSGFNQHETNFWVQIPEHLKPRILAMVREHPSDPRVLKFKSALLELQRLHSNQERKDDNSTDRQSQANGQSQQRPQQPQDSWRTHVPIERRRMMFDDLVRQIIRHPPFSQLPRSDRAAAMDNENLVRKFILEQVTEVWKMSTTEGEFLQHISALPARLIRLYRPE